MQEGYEGEMQEGYDEQQGGEGFEEQEGLCQGDNCDNQEGYEGEQDSFTSIIEGKSGRGKGKGKGKGKGGK
jgi:hypothetical protein